jgi:ornithine carbamoyltransferase
MDLVVCVPKGYEPDARIFREAQKKARKSGARIVLSADPLQAAEGAEVLYTDVWTSMGKEREDVRRKSLFKDYQVNQALLARAKEDVLVMHCLPAHRGEEITDEVMDGPHSIVFDQAENRLHAQKAILEALLGQESKVKGKR